jgi:hypothetical protein
MPSASRMPREISSEVQLPGHLEATASSFQWNHNTVQAGSRPWYCPCDVDLSVIQNASVTGSWRHPVIFQRTNC